MGSVDYGTPGWLASTGPLASTPRQRLVKAQDTGSAITGAVGADRCWRRVGAAQEQARRMKQPLPMFVLWPNR